MSGSSDEGAGGRAAPGNAETAPDDGALSAAKAANRTVVRTRSVIRTGEVTLTSKHLDQVRDDVEALLVAIGGTVGSEQVSNDGSGRIERSTLVLRVPVDKFTVAKKALMRMGKLEGSDESAKDVTTEVIDVGERVETLQNSLDKLQRYQRNADDVTDLLDFEEKITVRQSELQSLQAQQSYLADQTSMSTITLHMSTPEKYVAPPDALRDAGFLSGLKAGWHALGDVAVVAVTVVGALLPFLVAGLLVGVPTWLGLRALLRRRQASRPAPAE